MPSKKNETNGQLPLNGETKTTPDAGRQSVALDAPGVAKAVAKRVLEDIDEYCVRTYDGGHRWHLGASLIGDACKRKLWYLFRWTYREQTDGRKQRLFNRGHREEARFTEWLKGIGAQVWTHETPDVYNEAGEIVVEGKQYRVSAVMGHFGGSLDGIARLPERYGIDEPVLLEFKTNGTGAGFNKLGEDGMPVAKPQHFAQTSTYGSDPAYGFRYVLYFNINKNDDSLHVELVKLDHRLGQQMREKAEQIIMSQTPPPRLSDNPTFKDCGYCPAKEICHKGAIPEKNCRSCKAARPVENGEWFCDVHNGVIPREFVPQGCPSYVPITASTQNV
uniref:Exonuclease n=1 Tax=Stenotrophomonas phage vB_SmaS_QH3 TaxID=3229738 RepID=A0AAU7YTI0_9CAUD